MNKKLKACGLFLSATLVLGISGTAISMASATTPYEADNLTIQLGGDEAELNFSWLTIDPTPVQVKVCRQSELEDGEFPASATIFDAVMTEVLEESSSSGGAPPNGGGPGGGPGGPGGPGGGTDTDGDGVYDTSDLCEDTPDGVAVNEDGCQDDDEDGIANTSDECLETPAGTVVGEDGCQLANDADGDGVLNDVDTCSETPLGSTVNDAGCPDEDGDGVADDDDQCPDTSSGTEVNEYGCKPTVYSCKVTMPNINSDTTYVYAVGYDDTYTDMDTFRTKGSDNYNFIFVGDPQIGASGDTTGDAEGWATTVTAALTKFEDTSFILSSGDQVETATSDTQYEGFFSAEELTSMPLAPANGNHDKSILYSYQFNVPNESDYGKLSSTIDEETITYAGDYWFTYGKVLFMVLNSNNSSAASHSEFMGEAIGANPSALWRVVVFHHSLYSSASHVTDVATLRTSLVPVMDDYNIDVVLAGHDHFYARTYPLTNFEVAEDNSNKDEAGRIIDPTGTVYFTADSASGSKYYNFNDIDGWTNLYFAAYSQPKEPSYLNVEVQEVENGDTFTVSAYRTADGSLMDTYTIIKVTGDLNSDGVVDRSDISAIRSLLRQSASVNPAADLDGDGAITVRDARKLILLYKSL